MSGYITVCYSNQNQDGFRRGVMRIRNGIRTEKIINSPLSDNYIEGVDYYIKADPNFDKWTYSICHRALRKALLPKDILFFRTLWRDKQYFVGYFVISFKTGDKDNPICHAVPSESFLINGYKFAIKPEIVELLNENANYSKTFNKKRFVSNYLSRYYLRLDEERTAFLKSEIDKYRQGSKS
jgi:hypothetical protein